MDLAQLLQYLQSKDTSILGYLPSMHGSSVPPKVQPGNDYDMYGFEHDPSMDLSIRFIGDVPHRPDKYKLPNSPTYSDESIYNSSSIFPGGKWSNIGDGLWNFEPSDTNKRNMSIEQLIDYFVTKERKGTTLQLPNGKFFEGTQ